MRAPLVSECSGHLAGPMLGGAVVEGLCACDRLLGVVLFAVPNFVAFSFYYLSNFFFLANVLLVLYLVVACKCLVAHVMLCY
jgi:hypothetical protein